MSKSCFAPGYSASRLEDRRFLTGTGYYVEDAEYPGQLHIVFVRSPYAHAAIRGVDRAAAEAMPGVWGVHTVDELQADGLNPLPCPAVLEDHPPLQVPPRHALALGRVRHVGEPVAAVVADTVEIAREAAEQVDVEYEELASVVDPRAALAPGAPLIWPECPGNLAFDFHKGDPAGTEAAFAAAAHQVELDLLNNRVCAAPMETRAGIATYDPETDRYDLFCNGQGLHTIRSQLAGDVFGLPVDRFRLHAPDVGGGFGLKNFLYPEWVVLPWAAKQHRRPIRWVEERSEQFAAAAHGRGMRMRGELALDTTGRFLALRAEIVADMGAYLSGGGPNVSTKACPTAMGGVYAIPQMAMRVRGVYTNSVSVDAYRGAGKPEANFLIERLIDAAARRCGFDPITLRTDNGFADFPHQTAWGLSIDSGQVHTNIERAQTMLDRGGFEKRRLESETAGFLRGQGFACFLETARGTPQEEVQVRFTGGDCIEIAVGTESHGQGHETAFLQIAADRLGVPVESLVYRQADTDTTRTGFGHGGARSMHMGGRALVEAIDAVVLKAKKAAGELLQVADRELEYDRGTFSVPSTGQELTLLQIGRALRDSGNAGASSSAIGASGDQRSATNPLDSVARIEDAPFTFPNGCHGAEVVVDPETGHFEIVSYVVADDYGALVNPRLTEGQVHGGVAQGLGQAIGELAVYDPDNGQLLSGTFMDYFLPRASDLPALQMDLRGTPTSANPLGVKGSGQAGAIAAPQTVVNAVLDALSPLHIDHLDMPLTAESVWRALRRTLHRTGVDKSGQ